MASAVLVSAAMASACLRRASRCSDIASGDHGKGFLFALRMSHVTVKSMSKSVCPPTIHKHEQASFGISGGRGSKTPGSE